MPHLVLLEDEFHLREIFRITVEMLGQNIQLHQFGNSDDALAYIQELPHVIDLYVLDIRVPGKLDGFELAKAIRSHDQETPIVVTSAYVKAPKTELEQYNLIWMEKPWHLMEIPTKIVPLMNLKN